MEKTNISIKLTPGQIEGGCYALTKMLTSGVEVSNADKGLMLETMTYIAEKHSKLKETITLRPRLEQLKCLWHSCNVAISNAEKMGVDAASFSNMTSLMSPVAKAIDLSSTAAESKGS